MDLTTKSATDLAAMTKAQIIASLLADRTETTLTDSADLPGRGQLRRTYETRDGTGKLLKTTTTTEWTYHPTGEVKDIVTTETDGGGKAARVQTVRHDKPGTQPRMVEGK